MSKFKVGDEVTVNNQVPEAKSKTGIVFVGSMSKFIGKQVISKVIDGGNLGVYYELEGCDEWFNKYTNPPHKHCELIKAWADGAYIEVECNSDKGRYIDCADTNNPSWEENLNYRIKPQKSDKDIEIERIESEMRKLADDLAKVKSN